MPNYDIHKRFKRRLLFCESIKFGEIFSFISSTSLQRHLLELALDLAKCIIALDQLIEFLIASEKSDFLIAFICVIIGKEGIVEVCA